MRKQLKLGIDLGGSKVEIIALHNGQQVLRRRAPTPQGDYLKTLGLIASLVEDCERELGIQGSVGVGIPGTRSPDHGRIKNANSQCLIGQDLQADLEQRLQRPVRLANDADCFTLSEACDGAGEGAISVFGVILGTGVGGGLVVRQQLLSGPNAIAGEWQKRLDELASQDPGGYAHQVQIHEGKGHWMELEDRAAIPFMEKFTRNPRPTKIVWHQDDVIHDRLYWVGTDPTQAAAGDQVTAERTGSTISLTTSRDFAVSLWLDDSMLDADQPVTVTASAASVAASCSGNRPPCRSWLCCR